MCAWSAGRPARDQSCVTAGIVRPDYSIALTPEIASETFLRWIQICLSSAVSGRLETISLGASTSHCGGFQECVAAARMARFALFHDASKRAYMPVPHAAIGFWKTQSLRESQLLNLLPVTKARTTRSSSGSQGARRS